MNYLDKKSLQRAINECNQIIIGGQYSDLLEEADAKGYKTFGPGDTYTLILLKKNGGDYSRKLMHNVMRDIKKDFLRAFRRRWI